MNGQEAKAQIKYRELEEYVEFSRAQRDPKDEDHEVLGKEKYQCSKINLQSRTQYFQKFFELKSFENAEIGIDYNVLKYKEIDYNQYPIQPKQKGKNLKVDKLEIPLKDDDRANSKSNLPSVPGTQIYFREPKLIDLRAIPLRQNFDLDLNSEVLGIENKNKKPKKQENEEPIESSRKSAKKKALLDKKGGEALEDINKYSNKNQNKKTMIPKTFQINGKNYYFGEVSLGIFPKTHSFRIFCARLHASIYWRLLIFFFTILNIVGYERVDFSPRLLDLEAEQNDSNSYEIACVIFFTIEFIVDVVTMGLFKEPRTYLRDGYNVLSLIVLISSWIYIGMEESTGFYTFVSVLRVFRPLKLIQISPQFTLYFTALLKTIPQLRGVFMSLAAIMIFYGILGLHIFMGAFDYRCRLGDEPLPDGNFPIAPDFQPSLCGNYECPTNSTCLSLKDFDLPRNWTERDDAMFNFGFTEFDNFGWSMLTVFHLARTTGWSSITFMYGRYLNRGIVVIYMVTLMLFSAYIIVNMMLGELYDGYLYHFEQLKLEDPNQINDNQEEQDTTKTKVKIQDLQKKLNQRDKKGSQELEEQQKLKSKEKSDKIEKAQVKEDSKFLDRLRSIKLKVQSIRSEKSISSFRAYLTVIVHSSLYNYLSTAITVSQALVLCSDRADMTTREEKVIKQAEFAFFWIYFLEFLARFVGMGWEQYFFYSNDPKPQKDPETQKPEDSEQEEQENEQQKLQRSNFKNGMRVFNGFDFVVITLNLIEYLIRLGRGDHLVYDFSTYGKIVSVTKCLRIFRVLYFCTSLHPLNFMIEAFGKTVGEIMPYAYIIVVIALIYSLIGYELFSHRMRFVQGEFPKIAEGEELVANSEPDRINFDTYFASFTAVTNFMLNEEWHVTLYNVMRTYSWNSVIYWLIVIGIGELIIVRFYLAFYINKLIAKLKDSQSIGVEVEEIEDETLNTEQNNLKILEELRRRDENNDVDDKGDESALIPGQNNHDGHKMLKSISQEKQKLITDESNLKISKDQKLKISSQDNRSIRKNSQIVRQEDKEAVYQKQLEEILREQIENMTPFERFQRYLRRKVVKAVWFEWTILVLIMITTILMAMDSPLDDPKSNFKYSVLMIDNVITGIYAIESVIKIVCYGFLFNEGAYLRDIWNIIDFFSLVIAIQSLLFANNLYVFKVLRAFRILKLLGKFEAMSLVLVSLGKSRALIFKLIIFAFSYLICYGLLAVKFLKGSYRRCVNVDAEVSDFVTTRQDCYDYGGDWIKADFHYDNIIAAVYNLFIIATCEGWSAFQFDAWDYNGVDRQPIKNQSFVWTFYITLHFFIGNLMVFNTFIGVLIEQFAAIKESLSKYRGMNEEEKEWAMIQDNVLASKPRKKLISPYDKTQYETEEENLERKKFIKEWRWKLHNLIYSTPEKWQKFNRLMDIFIILNAIVFMLHFDRMPEEWSTFLRWANNVFVIIFFLEIVTKIYLFRRIFFQSWWNCFEVFLLITALIAMFWQETDPDSLQENKYIRIFLRLLQVFRVLRLIKSFEFLEKTFSALIFVIPKVGGVGAVFLLTLYVFALFGYSLFPYIRTQTFVNGVDLHFRSFSGSIISLIRVASGEQWFLLVGDIQRDRGPHFQCESISDYEGFAQYGFFGCGNVYLTRTFFLIFHLFVSVIILNLLIAMILSSSLEHIKLEKSAVKVFQLNKIIDLWEKYDPEAYGFIGYKEFWTFAIQMAMIYGVEQREFLDLENKKKFMIALSIPIYESEQLKLFGYKFHDVILKMTALSLFIKTETFKEAKDTPNTNPLFTKTDFLSGDMAYIILMQRKIKAWCVRTQEKKQLALQEQKSNPNQTLQDLEKLN